MEILDSLNLQKTKNPRVYIGSKVPDTFDSNKTPCIILVGGSGVGKDAIKDLLVKNNLVRFWPGSTTRKRRILKRNTILKPAELEKLSLLRGNAFAKYLSLLEQKGVITAEPYSEYLWMRGPFLKEDNYKDNLIKEYKLLECDFHHGFYYGLSLHSLKDNNSNLPLLIRSEPVAAQRLFEMLKRLFWVVIIMIVPDSLEQMEKRIFDSARSNPELRYQESLKMIKESPSYVHYYVHNSENPLPNGISGLEASVGAIKEILSGKFNTKE